MKAPVEKIEQLRGTHIIVYFGDGSNREAERIFSSGSCEESKAVCDLLLKLFAKRQAEAMEAINAKPV